MIDNRNYFIEFILKKDKYVGKKSCSYGNGSCKSRRK